jgi:hypothetical protein
MMEPLLAHQGGWDEILMFAVPAGLAIFGLRWAERRARQRADHGGASGDGAEDRPAAPPSSGDPGAS